MRRYILCGDEDPAVLEALKRDMDLGLQRAYQVEFCDSIGSLRDRVLRIVESGEMLAAVVCRAPIATWDGVDGASQPRTRMVNLRAVLLRDDCDGAKGAEAESEPHCRHRYVRTPWDVVELNSALRSLLDEFEREMYGDTLTRGDLYNLGDYQRCESPDLYAKVEAFAEWWTEMAEQPLWGRALCSPCRPIVDHRRGPTEEPRPMVMLASNNYLDLTTHPKMVAAAHAAIDRYGVGTGAVPLLSGTFELHRELESALTKFKGGQACCIFPSGYSANVGIISGIARETDTVFIDELVHASIVDGARMSRARVRIIRHNDMNDLAAKLAAEDRRAAKTGKLIVVDAVYSMDGDIAPLPTILELARRYGAKVMVDEAHSTGVIGERGHGIGEHFQLTSQIDIVMGTFSKALGSIGGFCVGPRDVIDYVRVYARSHMFSTSLPPATVASTLAALDVIDTEPERVEALRTNHTYLRAKFNERGFDTRQSETAIIPIVVGDNVTLWRMGRELDRAGIYVNAVPFPAVPQDLPRLRFSVMASHRREDLDRAVDAVTNTARKYRVLP